MAFIVIQKGGFFYVKNTTTGKIGSNKFKERINAEKQVKNRIRFQKLMKKQGNIPINNNQQVRQSQGRNKKGRKGKKT
mgnify:CR=1 FL=1